MMVNAALTAEAAEQRTTAMSTLSQITRGKRPAPRRTMLYGVQGIGKSTFGAMAPSPVFIQTEDGLRDIDCHSFPLALNYEAVVGSVSSLYSGDHDYQTVVVDSLDWLERLIWERVCDDNQVASIEKIGYGKGYAYALQYWREFLAGMDALRSDRGMGVILLAHAKIEKFENPETAPYDRYSPRLHKTASAMVQEWADEVLFAAYRVFAETVSGKFGTETNRAVGTGQRIIRTTERPTAQAKNRLGMPDEIPLDYREYAKYLPQIKPNGEPMQT